jgi:hypothetical protein
MPSFLSQLLSYSILTWVISITITFVGAHYGKGIGLVIGQVLIASRVICLDLEWLRDQAQLPDWDGKPDQDSAFYMGLFGRIVLINTVLLPIAFYTLRFERKRQHAHPHNLNSSIAVLFGPLQSSVRTSAAFKASHHSSHPAARWLGDASRRVRRGLGKNS